MGAYPTWLLWISHEQLANFEYVSELFMLVVSKVSLTLTLLMLLGAGHREMATAQVPKNDGRPFVMVTVIKLSGSTLQMQPVVVAVDRAGQPAYTHAPVYEVWLVAIIVMKLSLQTQPACNDWLLLILGN